MTPQPPSRPDHSRELESIRDWLWAIEAEAGPGYFVDREPQPPYGWNLFDPEGTVVCSGSLDKIEKWLRNSRTDER
ncbi:hypothetical protein NDR87_15880 [Nocardia sp. CDC159]|uniref:Uncharacterized protein n=1 Tax=Nocardia pulmonis TaxID=2951408 RepID=A0A9X2E7A7_9NOCA|nr:MULTISPECIES: hypothetical protein [Nocardia]MCM6775427.1 hypothetical protein [Nocardia pulmonis]MCM6787839.1 hypothetical protein [Nocardia sp. CDC159]